MGNFVAPAFGHVAAAIGMVFAGWGGQMGWGAVEVFLRVAVRMMQHHVRAVSFMLLLRREPGMNQHRRRVIGEAGPMAT